jgi:hypothetical protein
MHACQPILCRIPVVNSLTSRSLLFGAVAWEHVGTQFLLPPQRLSSTSVQHRAAGVAVGKAAGWQQHDIFNTDASWLSRKGRLLSCANSWLAEAMHTHACRRSEQG